MFKYFTYFMIFLFACVCTSCKTNPPANYVFEVDPLRSLDSELFEVVKPFFKTNDAKIKHNITWSEQLEQ